MSSARLFRPLARAVERQAFAAPTSMRTAAKVAPFTPSFNGQKYTVAQKTEAKMVRSTHSLPAIVCRNRTLSTTNAHPARSGKGTDDANTRFLFWAPTD